MELECSSSNGFVLLDYKDALLRWSKSWAELAEDHDGDNQRPEPELADLKDKLEDLDSDAGYASEGSCRRFYFGSKSGSVGSLEQLDDCAFYEEDYARASDDVYDIPDSGDDATESEDGADHGEAALDVNIEMIGSECVLVNGYKADDIPYPSEPTRDGLTPEVILEYDHGEVVSTACKFLSHLEGRNERCIRPKIYWAMSYAPEFEDSS